MIFTRTNEIKFTVTLIAVFWFSAIASAAQHASKQSSTKWKFTKGDIHDVEIHQEMLSTTAVSEREIKVGSAADVWLTLKVVDVNEAGEATIISTINRAAGEAITPTGKIAFDTDKFQRADDPMGKMLDEKYRVLVGVDVQLTMTSSGRITETEIPKSVPAQCANGTCRPAQQIEAFQSVWAFELGKTAGTIGGSWTTEFPLETPQGNVIRHNTYTNLGPQSHSAGQCIKFSNVAQVEHKPIAAVAGAPEMSLKNQKSNGTILFNPKSGHLQEGQLTQTYDLEVKVGKQQIVQKIETNHRVRFVKDGDGSLDATGGAG